MYSAGRKKINGFLLLFGLCNFLLTFILNRGTANAEWPADPTVNMPICNAAGGQSGPKLIRVTDGYMAVWQDQRRGSYTDIYAQKFDVDGNIFWEENGRVVAQALTNSLEYLSQVNPHAVSDLEGGAIIGWTDVNLGNIYDSNSWATRLYPDGAVNWGDPGLPVQGSDTAVRIHGGLRDITGVVGLAPDGEGGVFASYSWGPWISWEISRYDTSGILRSSSGYFADRGGTMQMLEGGASEGRDSVIVAWRGGTGSGPLYIAKLEDEETNYPESLDTMASLWDSIELSLSDDVGDIFGLISAGEGGAIIAWADTRNGNADVFAQKINPDGSLAWTSGGVPIAVQPENQLRPQLVSDGSGGAVIVWDDSRTSPTQVYAQRIDGDGNLLWASDGIPISSIRGALPKITRSDAGKYIIAWIDNDANGGTPDYLRVQKIDGMGNLYWPAEGDIIGDIYTTEYEIASDDNTGAIVVWSPGDGDIYGKRLIPAIGYSQAPLSFLATYGSANPLDQTLEISNAGYDTLDWSASSDATWLSLDPTSGTNSGTVTVSVDISGVLPGTYDASIKITGTAATNSPVIIPVTLTINPPSRMLLISPNGGDVIPSGESRHILWTGPAEAVKFKLKYSLTHGLTWATVHPEPYVTGTEYIWQVPKPLKNKTSCLLKVTGYTSAGRKVGFDISDETFAIEVLTVTSPKEGDLLTSGQAHKITWTKNQTKRSVAKVKIYYTTNGGTTWLSIKGPPTGDPGYFN
jgi:hypothetical protein